ncbi:hypothetical protein GS501_08620, partial [Saccharibacter sp. 17.LH.SD]|nr:hypothetical protein [Saccharibacter sp. 17.LH.SD]
MPVVTVIGASSRPFSIPISGNRVNTLGGQFEKSVGNAIGGGIPSGSDSVAGNGGGISMRSLDASDGLPTGVASSSSLDVGTVNGGENKFINNLGSHNTIYGGQGDTISAVDDLHVFQPGTDNRVTVGGSLTFVGGQGSESLHAGNATIYAGSGVVYHYVGTNAGNTQLQFEVGGSQNKNGVTLYEGVKGDKSGVLFDASSSHGSLLAHVGNGDTIIGGSASDTISVNNASAGA